VIALPLLAALSLAGWPKDASPSPVEKAELGPLEVCSAMAQAVKDANMDALVGHTTAYSRQRFGEKAKLALKGLHGLLIGVRCVRISSEDDAASPARAMVWIYAPQGKSRDLPFVKEAGFWRYDHETYERLHKKD
jgi:hypothetical protein